MRVKIVNGGYGYREGSKKYTRLATKGDVIDIGDAEAERLIRLGVAESLETSIKQGGGQDVYLDPAADSQDNALESMSLEQLKALAKENGLKGLRTKQELIGALSEHEKDDSVAPEITAEQPV